MSCLPGGAGTDGPGRMSAGCLDAMEPMSRGAMRPRLTGSILSAAACLIVSTNLLVALSLLKLLLRRSSQSWCFVLNLALADTLVGVAITGLAVEDFAGADKGALGQQERVGAAPPAEGTPPAQGKTRCLMRMAFVTSPCTASIMSMFLISLDRYAAIKMPLRYSLLSGRGTAAAALLALWVSAFTLGFLPVMVRQLQAEGYGGFCAFFSVVRAEAVIVLFSLCFFPVLALFVYIYLDILKIACSHQRQICQVRQAGSRMAERQQQQQQRQQRRSGVRSHVKALRTVALLVGCFLLLWCPFFVVSVVHILCERCHLAAVLENYLWLLGLSNSLVNPLVYAFWQREVRLQLTAMFSCAGGAPAAGAPSVVGPQDSRGRIQVGVSGGGAVNPALLLPSSAHGQTPATAPPTTTSL